MCVCGRFACSCLCDRVMIHLVDEALARYKESTLPRFFSLWQGHLATMRLQVTCLYHYNLRCRQKPFFEVSFRVRRVLKFCNRRVYSASDAFRRLTDVLSCRRRHGYLKWTNLASEKESRKDSIPETPTTYRSKLHLKCLMLLARISLIRFDLYILLTPTVVPNGFRL